MAAVERPTALSLAKIASPVDGQERQFFTDWNAACRHLKDHVLSSPECEGWRTVMPEMDTVADWDDWDALQEYVGRAQASQGMTAQGLYDLYAQTASNDCRDAQQLKWYAAQEGVLVALGPKQAHGRRRAAG